MVSSFHSVSGVTVIEQRVETIPETVRIEIRSSLLAKHIHTFGKPNTPQPLMERQESHAARRTPLPPSCTR